MVLALVQYYLFSFKWMPSYADCSEISLIYTEWLLSFLAIWVGYVASAVSCLYNQIMFLIVGIIQIWTRWTIVLIITAKELIMVLKITLQKESSTKWSVNCVTVKRAYFSHQETNWLTNNLFALIADKRKLIN